MTSNRSLTNVFMLFVLVTLAACGGGEGGSASSTYTLGGTVSGLGTSESVVLQNNGGNDLTVSANGSFTIATSVVNGASYAITVSTQPIGKTCIVGSGTGTISAADVTNVAVTCTTNLYTVSFSVAGMDTTVPSAVQLQINGGETMSATDNALRFTFPTPIAHGSAYNVTLFSQPTGQSCTVSNGSGTISAADVTNVAVTCATYTVSFSVAGLDTTVPSAVQLQINGGETISATYNALRFTFPTGVTDGNPYNVTLVSQPANGQICTISNGTGTISGASVTDIAVTCAPL